MARRFCNRNPNASTEFNSSKDRRHLEYDPVRFKQAEEEYNSYPRLTGYKEPMKQKLLYDTSYQVSDKSFSSDFEQESCSEVKVDGKTKEKLDEYKATKLSKVQDDDEKKTEEKEDRNKKEGETSDDVLDEMTKQIGDVIIRSLESLLNAHALELKKPSDIPPPVPVVVPDKPQNSGNHSPKIRSDYERLKKNVNFSSGSIQVPPTRLSSECDLNKLNFVNPTSASGVVSMHLNPGDKVIPITFHKNVPEPFNKPKQKIVCHTVSDSVCAELGTEVNVLKSTFPNNDQSSKQKKFERDNFPPLINAYLNKQLNTIDDFRRQMGSYLLSKSSDFFDGNCGANYAENVLQYLKFREINFPLPLTDIKHSGDKIYLKKVLEETANKLKDFKEKTEEISLFAQHAASWIDKSQEEITRQLKQINSTSFIEQPTLTEKAESTNELMLNHENSSTEEKLVPDCNTMTEKNKHYRSQSGKYKNLNIESSAEAFNSHDKKRDDLKKTCQENTMTNHSLQKKVTLKSNYLSKTRVSKDNTTILHSSIPIQVYHLKPKQDTEYHSETSDIDYEDTVDSALSSLFEDSSSFEDSSLTLVPEKSSSDELLQSDQKCRNCLPVLKTSSDGSTSAASSSGKTSPHHGSREKRFANLYQEKDTKPLRKSTSSPRKNYFSRKENCEKGSSTSNDSSTSSTDTASTSYDEGKKNKAEPTPSKVSKNIQKYGLPNVSFQTKDFMLRYKLVGQYYKEKKL